MDAILFFTLFVILLIYFEPKSRSYGCHINDKPKSSKAQIKPPAQSKK